MRAKDVIRRYAMEEHIENGAFIELDIPAGGDERPSSGAIYYCVRPGEITEFHRIDCDEYWIFNAGSPVEVWSFETDGSLRKVRLGLEPGSEPLMFLPSGAIFGSRLPADSEDSCLLTCVTVPKFRYEGFELIDRERMLSLDPRSAGFWTWED